VAVFGEGFRQARRRWLYDAPTQQAFGWALSLSIALIVLHFLVFQSIFALATYYVAFGDFAHLSTNKIAQENFIKSAVIGLAPAGFASVLTAFLFARFRPAGSNSPLPFQWPRLGFLGWALIIIGFMVAMYVVAALFAFIANVNPNEYSPFGEGDKAGSKAGGVEKSVAGLAGSPVLLTLGLLGVVIFGPLAEEVIFRGLFFSALINTRLGRPGTVVVTSAVWALLHLSAAPIFFVSILFVMGLLLGYLLLKFGSLWVPLLCHMLWNSMFAVAMVYMAFTR
jgi:membrane protease YdiL (CAAX protease family)